MKGSLMQREWSMKILHLLLFTYISKYLLFFFGSRYSYTRGLHHWLALLQLQLSLTPVYCISHYSLCSSHYPLYACVCCLLALFFSHFFILRSSTSCACAVTHEHQRMLDIRAVARVLRSMCTIYIYIPYVTHQVSLVHKSSGEWFFFLSLRLLVFFFIFCCLPLVQRKRNRKKAFYFCVSLHT